MYTVYILQDSSGLLYKGMTDNLNRRLIEHRQGKTKTTKKMSDIIVIHTEKFKTRAEARQREKYFKTAAGRRFIKFKILKNGGVAQSG